MTRAKTSVLRRIVDVPAEIIVALFVIADAIIRPLFRPIVRFLSSLEIMRRIERWIDRRHPYTILVLLGVPFAIAELTKVLGVFLMSEGHFHTGMTLFIGAYVVSILVCERIFHAGKNRLLTIRWFAIGYGWVLSIKDAIFGWLRETRVWRFAADVKRRAGASFQRLRVRVRAAFAAKPKGVYER